MNKYALSTKTVLAVVEAPKNKNWPIFNDIGNNVLSQPLFTPDSFSAFKNKILKNVFLDYTIGSD